MNTQPSTAWRIAAAILWIVSIVCLFQAVNHGVSAEQSQHNPSLTAANRLSIQHETQGADHWAVAGWILQFATAAALAAGTKSPRVVRRIFVSLGILIAADGTTLLLIAIVVHLM